MRKRKEKPLGKRIFGWLHLWLGMVAGIIVVISMLGATIFVWEENLTNWWYTDMVYTDGVYTEEELLPVSEVFGAVQEAYPDKSFTFSRIYREASRNYVFSTFKRAEEPGLSWASGIEYYLQVYVNPYTGQVAGQIDKKRDWITLSRYLHQNLLLKHDIGGQIVGAAALIMIFLALSGLYLWWPRNKAMLKRRLKIKWNGRFKRVNWDVHSVGGFYTYLLLILFAATGLVWSYGWWSDGLYRLFGSDPEQVFERPDPPELSGADQTYAINLAFEDAKMKQPNWYKMSFSIPRADSEKGVISARMNYKHENSWWETTDQYRYHPETGEVVHTFTHNEKQLGEKWRNSNYAIHVGSIYGTPTKIIASLCALFFATLPISGFLIWFQRRKKKKRKWAENYIVRSKAIVQDTSVAVGAMTASKRVE
ncbi:MAG: PepSY-associated TM helix domain-containing protein [Bacteroidota bacterium]